MTMIEGMFHNFLKLNASANTCSVQDAVVQLTWHMRRTGRRSRHL